MSWLEAGPGQEEEEVVRKQRVHVGRLAPGSQGTSLERMLQLPLLSWAPLSSLQSSGSALPSLSK